MMKNIQILFRDFKNKSHEKFLQNDEKNNTTFSCRLQRVFTFLHLMKFPPSTSLFSSVAILLAGVLRGLGEVSGAFTSPKVT